MASVLKFLLSVCCIAVSSAYNVTIHGVGTIDVPLSAVETRECLGFVTNFTEQHRSPTGEGCTSTELATQQWNNYKLGFSASGRDFGTSHTTCVNAHNGNIDYYYYEHYSCCDYIWAVFIACKCDRTTCITKDVLKQVEYGNQLNRTSCSDLPTKLCKGVQNITSPVCEAALSRRVTGPCSLRYDKTKLQLHCPPDRCPRIIDSIPPGDSIPPSSGYLKLSTTVAIITLMASLIMG